MIRSAAGAAFRTLHLPLGGLNAPEPPRLAPLARSPPHLVVAIVSSARHDAVPTGGGLAGR
eukprot:15450596-Alexandrium_andersonii.AAC.1